MVIDASTIAELAHPSHSCLVYDKPAEQIAVTTEFLARGLTRGEKCVFLETPEKLEAVREALALAGIDVVEEESRGALVLTSGQEYLVDGDFHADHMLDFLDKAVKQALADGYTALRATGDMNWEMGPKQDFHSLPDYEARLDQFATHHPVVGLCQYRRHSVPGQAIRNALETHQKVVLGQALCPNNLYYESPDIRLEQDSTKAQDKRVEWMCRRLGQAMKSERERDIALRAVLHSEHRLAEINQSLEKRVAEKTEELRAAQEAISRRNGN